MTAISLVLLMFGVISFVCLIVWIGDKLVITTPFVLTQEFFDSLEIKEKKAITGQIILGIVTLCLFVLGGIFTR